MEEVKDPAVSAAAVVDASATVGEVKVKKSWKKRLLKIFGVLFLLGVVAMIAVYIWLGNIIAVGINTAGADILGVREMRVESVKTNLLAGRFYLKGFFIGNPDGFNSEYLFKVDEVRIDVKPFTWFSKTFIINEIYIDGAKVIYHKNLLGGSNVDQVIKNLNSRIGAGGSKPDSSKPRPKSDKQGGMKDKKLIAHSIVIRNMGAKLVLSSAPGVPMTTGDITLSEVGSPDGITMLGLIERMLLDSVNVFEKGAQALGKIGGATVDAAGNVIKGTGDVLKGTGGALKGMFGGKKDEPAAPKTPEVPKK